MFIIGITGGSGAGKSSALRALERLGALALDCDAVYHGLLATDEGLKSELETRFAGVLLSGEIDRRRLAAIVFSDPSALADLNTITHKYVSAEIERLLAQWEQQGGTVAAIDAIALIQSGRSDRCNVVVGVTAPEDERISRIMERDALTLKQARQRISAQKPDNFYCENCDYILENFYESPAEFDDKCVEFFDKLIGGQLNAG
ncbi:MAG: dephospho-CoA kinase [Oscillospiraceae bacterium]|jgi:dephospho-CoA kinase|nr:dephospho-CoA kinase [Oscillospiraceae bacterium]